MTTKEAYFKLCEALHQLPYEYHEAMEIVLNILQQKIEEESKNNA